MKPDPLKLSRRLRGKIEVISKIKLTGKNLPALYTPGVAMVSKKIAEDRKNLDMTIRDNTIAVISDGSAVLGLGNIGPEAALPVMEGKALIFKELGGVNAFPIVLSAQGIEEIISAVRAVAPTFGGINLEDIAAPKCFEIEKRLRSELDIPVVHDDQHATSIVVLAGLINALKVVKKKPDRIKLVLSGAGAAGTAVVKLLHLFGIKNMLVCDSRGVINKNNVAPGSHKEEIARITNGDNISGSLSDALAGADVFIGVSSAGILSSSDISRMARYPVVFALANPVPEIYPDEALKGGAAVVATGRSDFPNQINNILAFPGIFKGLLESKRKDISDNDKIKAAVSLAGIIKNPTRKRIIVGALDKRAVRAVSAVFK